MTSQPAEYEWSEQKYGLYHPTWDAPDCFYSTTAENALAAAIRTYGEGSGHIVVERTLQPVIPPGKADS